MGAAHPERNKENPAAQTNRGLLNKQGGGGVKVGAIHLGNTAWKQVRSSSGCLHLIPPSRPRPLALPIAHRALDEPPFDAMLPSKATHASQPNPTPHHTTHAPPLLHPTHSSPYTHLLSYTPLTLLHTRGLHSPRRHTALLRAGAERAKVLPGGNTAQRPWQPRGLPRRASRGHTSRWRRGSRGHVGEHGENARPPRICRAYGGMPVLCRTLGDTRAHALARAHTHTHTHTGARWHDWRR